MTAPGRPARTIGLLLFVIGVPSTAGAQDRGFGVAAGGGAIEIVEPVEWRPVETRGIEVRERASVRVVGFVTHGRGVEAVFINGDRAALTPTEDGRYRFVGYVRGEPRMEEVEVAAFTRDEQTLVRTFRIEVRPADQVYADPDEAWGEGQYPGRRWAVVVGVSRYRDPRVPALRYADRDARAFYDFLVSDRAGLGGIPEENIILLLNENATHYNLRTALFTFLKGATEDDQVFIYFAGHGAPDPERLSDLYLLPFDTDAGNLSGSAFPMGDVAAATRDLLARDIVVITDACHSAGVGGQVALRDPALNQINRAFLSELQASTGGLTIFTASQASQASHEGDQWGGGHGVFTYHMLNGLNGAADEDQDRIVTLVEMMEYTRERVRRETRNAQIPSISQTAFDPALPLSMVLDPALAVQDDALLPAGTPGGVALPSMFQAAAPADVPEPEAPAEPETAFARGLMLPGGGMFYVRRPMTGVAYGVATAGLLAAGFGLTVVEPGLAIPAAAAGLGTWFVGAVHARSIARSAGYEGPAGFSPAAAVALGIVVPGGGQFYTGRTGRGILYLALGGAALASAIEPISPVCADYEQHDGGTQCALRLGAWAGITLIGAVDGFITARSSRQQDRFGSGPGGPSLRMPSVSADDGGGLAVSLLRLRF